jgi:hypothetical protein
MDVRLDQPRARAGGALGNALAPAMGAISRWRHARMFHPVGVTYAGYATLVEGPFERLGYEISGRVLARCSAALWRKWEHLDVLGMALRFRQGPGPDLDEQPRTGDQDLLTATIRSPLTMLASPLFTNVRQPIQKYWAVSPFQHAIGRVELRLVPVDRPARRAGSRVERLDAAVRGGDAAWWLQARRTLTPRWHRVVRIRLDHRVELDQEALAFDPFRGTLRPVGLVQAIRRAVYAASQRARPRHEVALSPRGRGGRRA